VTEGGEAMPDMQNWLVIRTRPRWEKKVTKLLLEKGIETFCPLVKMRRQWSDRVKTIELPLLKTLLFVCITEDQRTTVRLTEGVVNFEYWDGKPVVLREKMIQQIKQFQQLHPQVFVSAAKPVVAEQPAGGLHKTATLLIENLHVVLVAGSVQPATVNASLDKI
jgi:transcription antitermination factor NusG